MDDRVLLRLLERTAENLQLVNSAADIRQVGQALDQDIDYVRARLLPFGASAPAPEPPIDVDARP